MQEVELAVALQAEGLSTHAASLNAQVESLAGTARAIRGQFGEGVQHVLGVAAAGKAVLLSRNEGFSHGYAIIARTMIELIGPDSYSHVFPYKALVIGTLAR